MMKSFRKMKACQAATVLELHESFLIKDFVVPLLLQDKLSVVEDFLEDSSFHQNSIVMFLDDLLEEKNIPEEMERISEELKVEDAKLHRFNQKYINKLIGRYLKDFKLSPELCPNYVALQKRKALHFVIWKKYIDKTLEGESWSEMMLEVVKDCPKLQYEMVESLTGHLDDDEAYRWCNYFQLDKEKLPARLKYMIETANLPNDGEEENWDDEEEIESWKNSPAVDMSNFPEVPIKMPKWKKP
ncbi:hypothetical protein J437_LFUL000423 [Ladona fulva]|uniref:Uncharacterized protein n=1 Tax=Ladona fulva TaxID=123851 RepID=A0A8K0K4I7_LADFU|nr:hypothetical protein J437_LFUL000423 [Ladona fulva]